MRAARRFPGLSSKDELEDPGDDQKPDQKDDCDDP
jgi:hypothetical protein